jgi:hypothetical protein
MYAVQNGENVTIIIGPDQATVEKISANIPSD